MAVSAWEEESAAEEVSAEAWALVSVAALEEALVEQAGEWALAEEWVVEWAEEWEEEALEEQEVWEAGYLSPTRQEGPEWDSVRFSGRKLLF